jgi:hypothetical protein
MRTKTVLLTTLLGAASIATSVAQTVYSVNAVGYVNVTVKAGAFALLANPLNQPTNSIAAVLPDAPVNTVVYIFNASGAFDIATKRATGWTGTGASAMLNPGTGFFIKNAGTTDMNITFVGEVPQGTALTVNYPAGFSIVGSIVPQAGNLEKDLGYPAKANDVVYKFDGTGYAIYTRRSTGAWTGVTGQTDVPLGVAEGVWLKAAAAGAWTRSFSVNQ